MFKNPTFPLPCAYAREIWRTRHRRMVQRHIPRWLRACTDVASGYQAARGPGVSLFYSVGLVEILYEALDPEIHHLLGVPESLQAGAARRSATLP